MLDATLTVADDINCRIGSLEKLNNELTDRQRINCRIGSLETG